LDVRLDEHILIPIEGMPNDVEELIMAMQRSLPFESFDPNEVLMTNTVRLTHSSLTHHHMHHM
jgi:hypothetical protein